MEYKAKLRYKILMGIIPLFIIVLLFWSFVEVNLFTRKLRFIILYFISVPIMMFLAIDELYQLFRIIIIDESNIKIKIFGRIIKEENIETIEYNKKHYGIRNFTHFGGVKSIIINNKYFSCITKMDDNYEEIKI